MNQKNIIIVVIAIIVIGGGAWLASSLVAETPQPNGVQDEPSAEPISIDPEIVSVLERAQDISSLKYDIVVAAPEASFTGQAWYKDDQFKMTMLFDNQEMVVFSDLDQELAYLYDPSQNKIIEEKRTVVSDLMAEFQLRELAAKILDYRPILVGREVIEGDHYLVIDYFQYPEGTRAWVLAERGLPVRMVTQIQDDIIEVRAENIEFDIDIADDISELPEDAEIDYLSDL